METWYTDYCPKCGRKNFICNGDESDLTRPDIDGVRCWKCNNIWSLETRKNTSEDNINWLEDGKEKVE